MKHINSAALACYSATHGTLIPLHRYDAESAKHGTIRKDGKRPIDSNWTKREYNSREVLAWCRETNHNVGVRLPASVVVVDIDPRNGGDEGWENLCLEFGLGDVDKTWPCVITGSGGRHYYLAKPADVPVVDTLKDFPGVEFKSKGRQVVAAGSIHPNGKYYEWREGDDPSVLPDIPSELLVHIRRPQRAAPSQAGGQLDQEQVEKLLAKVDPKHFRDHDRWLKLMMGLHHASSGDARQEWVDWCISDPDYKDNAEEIGRRWDSLHRQRAEGVVTIGTVRHMLSEEGALDALPPDQDAAVAEFAAFDEENGEDDVSEEPAKPKKKAKPRRDDEDDGVKPEGEYDAKSLGVLQDLNETYTATFEGGKFRVLECKPDPVMNRPTWERYSSQDFEKFFANRRIERDVSNLAKGASPTVQLGKAWIEWEGRRTVKGIVFDPEREHAGWLNLWTGFATEASVRGTWDRLKELTRVCLCNGDDAVYKYVMNWMAYLFQHPGHHAEAAVVFKGKKGIGKGTLGNTLVKLIGRHAISIGSPDMLTGRFNAHLEDCLFLFADEAVRPFDKAAESKIKHLISEPLIQIEPKGVNAHHAKNMLHVMMATNEKWAISASDDERRYVVSEANDKWAGKHDKWEALQKEMREGGFGRMLHDLLSHKLPDGWHPRHIVNSAGLTGQKLRNLSAMQTFLFNACYSGIWPTPVLNEAKWERGPIRFFYEDLRNAFGAFCRESGVSAGNMNRNNTAFFIQEFTEVFKDASTRLRLKVPDDSTVNPAASDGRAQAIELPSLQDCRSRFDDMIKAPTDWNEVYEDDFDFN
ncbi:bifunctional DNA primase/polymerase [Bradyrhizobium sp. 153]|uniref:bifunctional DNA primase/polymerase n=1 Tax=Bradyrhizobium sp. 153 TaxID=2782627 RepID=UPI001FF7F73E|nr:bifunctional DNA primase/polymerase [Bradyrhizobium sp. 153]MCK1668634.1 bifunctional DNA primase/polymerase [Bradyrhizobium sp. 153]